MMLPSVSLRAQRSNPHPANWGLLRCARNDTYVCLLPNEWRERATEVLAMTFMKESNFYDQNTLGATARA